MHRTKELLGKFDFSNMEAEIYTTLLYEGPFTLTELSQVLGTNRVTLHFNLKELLSKKIIFYKYKGKKRFIHAYPLNFLENILEQKREKLDEVEHNASKMILELQKKSPLMLPSQTFQVKYYQGRQSVKQIYDEILKAKEVRAFVSDELDHYFPENMELFITVHNKRNDFYIWEIMNDNPINEAYARKMNPKRYWYKLVPGKLNIIDYIIYDGKIMYVDAESKEPDSVMAFVIDNINIYNNAKLLFDFIWNAL